MTQYNFGTIDPYVVDGVQLASMLNNWRDAVHSWHRGAARPSYIVPGMMWINDAGGPTNWIVNVYMSPTIGDRPVFNYDTTTGDIIISASTGGTFASAILLAQAAASPSVRWNATGNPIDQKAWRATVNGVGALVLSSYSDAGVLQQSITFNRDGTIGTTGGVLAPLPAARFTMPSNVTYGVTGPLALPMSTTIFNFGAGTFTTNGAPNGNHMWVPGAGLWSIEGQVGCFAGTQQAAGEVIIRRFVGGVGTGDYICYWAGYWWQSQNTCNHLAVTAQLGVGDGLQLQVTVGAGPNFAFLGTPYSFFGGVKVR